MHGRAGGEQRPHPGEPGKADGNRGLQCNAESAAIETARGVLQLAGAQLNVTSLDLDSGEVKLTGRIDTVEYTAARTPGGFLSRLLR